ncbi:hypothetical protein B0H10DRAFT_1938139 [Mycena sp. CBHHK59/15]|nr:hypothetical protein B0H10DRAFT_1938139 [Mycena sp. CBHHK59/15]
MSAKCKKPDASDSGSNASGNSNTSLHSALSSAGNKLPCFPPLVDLLVIPMTAMLWLATRAIQSASMATMTMVALGGHSRSDEQGEESASMAAEIWPVQLLLPESIPTLPLLESNKGQWTASVYQFFKVSVLRFDDEECPYTWFACNAKRCKATTGAAGNLKRHAVKCFTEAVVEAATSGAKQLDKFLSDRFSDLLALLSF